MKVNGILFKRMKNFFGIISFLFIIAMLWAIFSSKDTIVLFQMSLIYISLCVLFVPFISFLGILKETRMRNIRKKSKIVHADIVDIEKISETKYIVKCMYKDNNRTYTFYSESLPSDPRKFIQVYKVLVYMDKENPEIYYVDMNSTYRQY